MKVHVLHQRAVGLLEPIPTGISALATVNLLERGRMHAGKAMTHVLRSLRRGQPMNWDPWILLDGDQYRLFYLRGLEGQVPWWTVSRLCGAVSQDMQHWQDLGTLLAPNPAQAWESGRVSAGCALKENGVYYLFYSAGGSEGCDLKSEGIGLATSTDGICWQRQYDDYPLIPDANDRWYGRCNWTGHFHWRDPYVFKDPQSERYYMFICASSKTPGNFQGSIGLAVADRLAGPYHILPPAVAATADTAADWAYYHMERPQVLFKNGKYHLFFSCFRMFVNPNWLKQVNCQRITNSSLYWYVSDKITGPFQPALAGASIVPNSEFTGMYGANLLPTADDLTAFIAYGWYHRLHALEISPTFNVQWHTLPMFV